MNDETRERVEAAWHILGYVAVAALLVTIIATIWLPRVMVRYYPVQEPGKKPSIYIDWHRAADQKAAEFDTTEEMLAALERLEKARKEGR